MCVCTSDKKHYRFIVRALFYAQVAMSHALLTWFQRICILISPQYGAFKAQTWQKG